MRAADVVHLAAVAQQAGFELDVVHEDDAAFLVLRVRLPKVSGGALESLIEMLTNKSGAGFYRAP